MSMQVLHAIGIASTGGDEVTILWEVVRDLAPLHPPTLRSQPIYIPPQQEKLSSDRQHHTKGNCMVPSVPNPYADKPFVQLIKHCHSTK